MFKNKQKNTVIKHKLWGELKQESHNRWRIVTSYNYLIDGTEQYYDAEFWCVNQYVSIEGYRHLTLEEAKKIVEEGREQEFYRLCKDALSSRRNKKLSKL